MSPIQEAIAEIIAKFEDSAGYIRTKRTNANGIDSGLTLTFNIEYEIGFMLLGLNLDHKVDLVHVDEDGDDIFSVLCISYVYDGQLETYNVPVINGVEE